MDRNWVVVQRSACQCFSRELCVYDDDEKQRPPIIRLSFLFFVRMADLGATCLEFRPFRDQIFLFFFGVVLVLDHYALLN
jgi:hypothetical protein